MLQRVTSGARHILMTTDAVGGVWQYALELACELARCGHTISLAGLGPRPSPEQQRTAEALVARLVWLDTPPDWLAGNAAELDRFPAEIALLLRDAPVDVVHINCPSLAADLDIEYPLVVVSHSCVTTWFEAVRGTAPDQRWSWHKPRNRRGFEHADAVIAPSASHAALLSSCYGAITGLRVVHNGIANSAGNRNEAAAVFAAARWWDEGKNASVLDAAAARCEWPVFAAGPVSGPNGEKAGFRHAIPLGPLPNGEVRSLMGQAQIFVSPSLYEPFGLATLEAASAGAALLLADIPTYRELWAGAAVFFSPNDPGDLAEGVHRLVHDKGECRALAAAARRRSHRFTVARQAQEMREVYDHAISMHASRS